MCREEVQQLEAGAGLCRTRVRATHPSVRSVLRHGRRTPQARHFESLEAQHEQVRVRAVAGGCQGTGGWLQPYLCGLKTNM